MKIINSPRVYLATVEHGECFLWESYLYIKLQETSMSVRLCDGCQIKVPDGVTVQPVKAQITYVPI